MEQAERVEVISLEGRERGGMQGEAQLVMGDEAELAVVQRTTQETQDSSGVQWLDADGWMEMKEIY